MNDADDPNRNTRDTEPNPPLPAPRVQLKDQGILSKSECQSTQKDKEPTEKRVREWLQFVVNIILVIVGIVAICIYYGQLQVMKGQLGEIIRQFPEIQKQAKAATDAVDEAKADSAANAESVKSQLGIAQQQAKATQASVDAIRRNMEVQQRAWVGPIPTQPIVIQSINLGPPDLVTRYEFTIKNFGPSPALNVTPIVVVAPGHDRLDATVKRACEFADAFMTGNTTKVIGDPKRPKARKWGNALFPGSEDAESGEDSVPSDPQLTVLYMVGCVAYRDQFKQTHHTRFCVETPRSVSNYVPGTPLVHCHIYNDTD